MQKMFFVLEVKKEIRNYFSKWLQFYLYFFYIWEEIMVQSTEENGNFPRQCVLHENCSSSIAIFCMPFHAQEYLPAEMEATTNSEKKKRVNFKLKFLQ